MIRRTTGWAGALALLAFAIGGSFGCVGGSKSNSAKDDERLKAYVARHRSRRHRREDRHQLREQDSPGRLQGRAEGQGSGRHGSEAHALLALRRQARRRLEPVHALMDANNERLLNIDNVGPLREIKDNHQALSPSAWEKGKIYVDEQSFRVPDEAKAADFAVIVGIWKGDARLKVVSGPNDGREPRHRRAVQDGRRQRARPRRHNEVPKLAVNRAGEVRQDQHRRQARRGGLEEGSQHGPFRRCGSGKPNPAFPVSGAARMAWDDDNLYVAIQVHDPDVVGGFPKDAKDPHLWTKDTVEIMLDPDGDGDNDDYYEIQVNPQNLVFDTQYDSYNAPKTEPDGPFGHQDWSCQAEERRVHRRHDRQVRATRTRGTRSRWPFPGRRSPRRRCTRRRLATPGA